MVLWRLEEGDLQKDSAGKLEVLEEAVTNSLIAPALGTASFFQGGELKKAVITGCKTFTVSKERLATLNSWQQLSSLEARTASTCSQE